MCKVKVKVIVENMGTCNKLKVYNIIQDQNMIYDKMQDIHSSGAIYILKAY